MSEGRDVTTVGGRDALTAAVSIELELKKSGVRLAAVSRAIAAADQLFGGLVGIPAGLLEKIRRGIQDGTERDARMRATVTDQAVRALEGTDVAGQMAARRFIARELRKQRNIEGVWLHTELALPQLPAPKDEAADAKISEDWLNVFSRYAEDASSDILRQQWGRILAGEIHSPSAFSLTTLRIVSELDAKVAGQFERFARRTFVGHVVRPDLLRGEEFIEISTLEDLGLVTGLAGNFTLTPQPLIQGGFTLRGDDFAVLYKSNEEISSIGLTRSGDELASILDIDGEAAARRFAALSAGHPARIVARDAEGRGTAFEPLQEAPETAS